MKARTYWLIIALTGISAIGMIGLQGLFLYNQFRQQQINFDIDVQRALAQSGGIYQQWNSHTSSMLKFFLEANGFAVTLCENGELAMRTYRESDFDLCILDVMMPYVDGFTVAETIVKSRKNTPFVFLTAKGLKEDLIRGYRSGAADYLVKPFDPEILLLKIQVLLRGYPASGPETERYTIGSYTFDPQRRALHLGEQRLRLSPKESELLQLLCERRDSILEHEEALLKIWNNDDYFTKQSMNVFITKLRKHLSQDPEYRIEIENVHSKGFLLKVERG